MVPGPKDLEFWDQRWREGRTHWDLGGPHPMTRRALEKAEGLGLLPHPNACVEAKAKVLIPGCGRAHDAVEFAAWGLQVLCSDIIAEAIAAGEQLYKDRDGVAFAVADALDPPSEWVNGFDIVFDRAMLCALAPAQRRTWAESTARCLKPNGIVISLPFSECKYEEGQSGPPFALQIDDQLQIMQEWFELAFAEDRDADSVYGADRAGKIVREMICIWVKNA